MSDKGDKFAKYVMKQLEDKNSPVLLRDAASEHHYC